MCCPRTQQLLPLLPRSKLLPRCRLIRLRCIGIQIPQTAQSYGPTFCVIPYDLYQNTGDTLWSIQAIGGSGIIMNDTTIEFTTGVIGNQLQYEAILMGLRVISGSDTITIPDSVARMTFTTIGLPVNCMGFSFPDSNGPIHQHDTLSAYFNTKLDSVNSPSGPLLSLVLPIISVDTTNDSVVIVDNTINTMVWLDPSDSSIIHTKAERRFGKWC